ncbi:MAG: formate--tetrahydrofolate ligase [Armatimonadetes bacterium]|nr:formate--tetrahydrofolate ligase [Armatimonadota bacterium]
MTLTPKQIFASKRSQRDVIEQGNTEGTGRRLNNLDIAQGVALRPIGEIADWLGLGLEDYDPIGRYKAKLSATGIKRSQQAAQGKCVLVTAITPTPAGEGKTTVSIGLAEGLNRIGKKALPALREPALGPVFGVKGGACGGGYSQVLPMEDINLFFNGDFPAITAAHNLLSAILDASLHQGNPLSLDLRKVWWPRAVDMIDRSLRETVVGLGEGNGPVRGDKFVITPASEVMAALCMSTSLHDLKERLARTVVGTDTSGAPVTAGQLRATGPMAALMRDAIRPNLVQTVEGGAALIHGGPFGNIAHGCSSVLASQCGLGLADYLVTEGGFGSDLGGEKFLNIVTPHLGRGPDAIVLVATVRALTYHGGGDLERGCSNLGQHIRHLRNYGPPVIVTVNRFLEDCPTEPEAVCKFAKDQGVPAVVSDPWNSGGAGCEELAAEVASLSASASNFRRLYDDSDPFATKLSKLVRNAYGGRGVTFAPAAERMVKWLEEHGLDKLPVCVAKTQSSLSDDPRLLGAPSDFDLHVRDIRLSNGAGFLVAICGEVMLMPGMGKNAAAFRIDVDDDGVIHGLN